MPLKVSIGLMSTNRLTFTVPLKVSEAEPQMPAHILRNRKKENPRTSVVRMPSSHRVSVPLVHSVLRAGCD